MQNLYLNNEGNTEELKKIFSNCNESFEKISDLSIKFNEQLEQFGHSFLKGLFEITYQNEDLHNLKDIIMRIKFDDKGRADYGGVRQIQENEMSYLQLAKIIISRDLWK